MGYQEVAIKLQPFKTEKKILKIVHEEYMEEFIELIGYYIKNKKKKYLVFATDRHPGADFLVKRFKAIPMENVYNKLEDRYIYKPIEGV